MPRERYETAPPSSPGDERSQVPQSAPGQPANGGNPTTDAALDMWLDLLTDIITNAVIAEQRETDRP